jgi:hypothetical protein
MVGKIGLVGGAEDGKLTAEDAEDTEGDVAGVVDLVENNTFFN